MRQRVRGIALALTVVFAGAATSLLAGSANAAAAPIVIGSCATSVQGTPGQPVSLAPAAVLGVVVDAVRIVDPLNLITPTVRNAFAGLPPIPIGALPTGTGYITGGQIANQVVAQLRNIPLLGPVIATVAGTVQGTLTSMCGVTVTGVNAAAAPVQEGAKSVADASQQATGGVTGGTPGGGTAPGTGGPSTGNPGGTPGSPGGTSPRQGANQEVLGGVPFSGVDLGRFMWTGRSPMADYSSIPFARPGLFAASPGVLYGGSVSGYTPQFGILGTDNPDGVQAAGHAEGLGVPAGNKIALPILLAVFALSGVTAALVRTWVLRKAPAL